MYFIVVAFQIDYSDQSMGEEGGTSSLEDFLLEVKQLFVEKISFTASESNLPVKISDVPPIIAPALRGNVQNTEMEKRSVYLDGKIMKKNEIDGNL